MALPLLHLPQELILLVSSFCSNRTFLNLSLTCSNLFNLLKPKGVHSKTKLLFLESWNKFTLLHTSGQGFTINPQVINAGNRWDQSTISSYYLNPSYDESYVAFILKRNPSMSMCFDDDDTEWDRIILIREYYHSTIFEITKHWDTLKIDEEVRDSLLSFIVRGQSSWFHPEPPAYLINL